MPDANAPRARSVTPGDQALATRARQVINTFRAEHPAEYQELVHEFDSRDGNLAVFGFGRINVRITNGEVSVEPGLGPGEMARGMIYMEALQAITQGVLTPLQAYFRGDVIVRAPSGDLHTAYGFFVRFAELAFGSETMRTHFDEFRTEFL
ncbi:hypothetical protein ACIRPU_41140 [Streptomyces sp. NPDC102259]|uniref:hypothetical protein n=1 Tax=Streptomyces sp. NPDC102259 TaxID=3366148 RepID=UPI0037F61DB2